MKILETSMLALAALVTSTAVALAAQPAEPWMKPDPAALQRWQAMRFGMFIHWGPVSLTAKEISWSRGGGGTPIEKYDSLYKEFNPTRFNADEWVSIAKAAGMKYIVLTTKHHDGFCLFDTKLTDYNIMNTPFKRDVTKELSDACKKQGIAFGAYYSVTDWHHPDFPLTSPGGSVKRETSDIDAYNKYLLGQIKELITNDGPLITIWNDVPQEFSGRGRNTIKLARTLQPDILLNDRTGDGGDYSTPEQHVGGFNLDRPWESCMTISAHGQWAWGGDKDGVKPLAAIVRMMVSCAGGDGNMLLNVGPEPTGVINTEQAARLKEMGAWMDKNGESIYGTRGGPWKPSKAVLSTRKENVVYVHLMAWDGDSITLPALGKTIKASSLLSGGPVKVDQPDKDKDIVITVAPADRQPIDTIVKLELDGPAMEIAPISQKPASGIKATASTIFSSEYSADMAVDDDPDTRWATPAGTKQAWLELRYPAPKTVNSVRIQEVYDRVQKFELQYKDGEEWKMLFTGTTMGGNFEKKFDTVTAQEFRLNIQDATEGPTISEIEFQGP